MHLQIQTVRGIYQDLLNRHISREDADKWARTVIQQDEIGQIEYVSAKEKNRIWRAVIYLNGIDLKNFIQGDALTGEGTYLHSDEDIRAMMQELFGN